MEIKAYMTDFPFDFFLIINNAKELGDILGATLMQFIQEK
jgi:midasin (ATPase involved in ribosome maturation)